MKKNILFIFLMIFFSCKEKSSKGNVHISEEKSVKEVKKENQKEEKEEELTTENCIAFLYEYGKKNQDRNVRISTEFGDIDI